jgi:hypothetical protein
MHECIELLVLLGSYDKEKLLRGNGEGLILLKTILCLVVSDWLVQHCLQCFQHIPLMLYTICKMLSQ